MEGANWDPVVHRVLAGNVDPAELPEIPQRVVRVYLNSAGVGKYLFSLETRKFFILKTLLAVYMQSSFKTKMFALFFIIRMEKQH